MITRYALFEGSIKPGKTAEFRAAVNARLVPIWTQFPGSIEVRVMFGEDRDEGAPEFPLILAISYRDLDGMAEALNSAPRSLSREITAEIVAECFDGRIHHHVTEASNYEVDNT